MRAGHGLILAAAMLALAGCGDKGEAEKADGAPDARSSAPSTPAAPASTPKLRAGLWRVSMSGEGPTGESRMCVNDAVQERMNIMGAEASGGACQQTTVTPNPGGGWRFRSVCDHSAMGGGTSVSEGVMTGDFRTGYSSRSTVTTTGAQVAHMNGSVTVSGEGRYEGPCPADWKPGDMEIPGGMRFNMVEMADQAKRMGR